MFSCSVINVIEKCKQESLIHLIRIQPLREIERECARNFNVGKFTHKLKFDIVHIILLINCTSSCEIEFNLTEKYNHQ